MNNTLISDFRKPIIYLIVFIGIIILVMLNFRNLIGVFLTLIATVSAFLALKTFGVPVFPFSLFFIVLHIVYIGIVYTFKNQWSMADCMKIACIYSSTILIVGFVYAIKLYMDLTS